MDNIKNLYNDFMQLADPRVEQWFLMSSPVPILSLTLLYLSSVYLGTAYMRTRPAFSLKPLIMAYNAALVGLSAYMCSEFILSIASIPNFSFSCQPVDYSSAPEALRLARVNWWFFFSKVIELFDTIFFVLRKKNNQVSFLHVYHHSTAVGIWWVATKFAPGGEAYYPQAFNSFVHVIMYSYYFLSAMGPAMQPYLWWKKYMTSLQLVQHVTIFLKFCIAGASGLGSCGYPVALGYFALFYMATQIILFANFYYQTYHVKPRAIKKSKGSLEINGKAKSASNGQQECDVFMKTNGRVESDTQNSNSTKGLIIGESVTSSKFTYISKGDNNSNHCDSLENQEKPRFRKRRPSDT